MAKGVDILAGGMQRDEVGKGHRGRDKSDAAGKGLDAWKPLVPMTF
jgi:hypothetical protein